MVQDRISVGLGYSILFFCSGSSFLGGSSSFSAAASFFILWRFIFQVCSLAGSKEAAAEAVAVAVGGAELDCSVSFSPLL